MGVTDPTIDLVINHIDVILIPETNADGFGSLRTINHGAIACAGDEIVMIGTHDDVMAHVPECKVISAAGKLVAPGFVDAHTHPVFFGTREQEFKMRALGKSYQDIALAGGGIRSSVRKLRSASETELIDHTIPHLKNFLRHGTTTIEAKSGYGLSVADEIKILRVIKKLDSMQPLDLVPTFLGAHEIPDEYRNDRQKYIDLIINEMIPLVVDEKLAEFCDIFCEEHVFTIEETIKILGAAKDAGLQLKIHSEQLASSAATKIAAELGVISADHLDYASDDSLQQMKLRGVTPVLLPGAVFFLGLKTYANARKMIDLGLPVALATDFNPGSCMTESLPIIMTIACTQMKMTPEESWVAATLNGARAIDRDHRIGTLKEHYVADLVVWDIKNQDYLPYHFGINHVVMTIKKGQIVFQNKA
ncbi:imidazolonepropionase [candidate division KSB1 bacterium]|nr:imidazolonepropionase [candidate division KSB1 bacterium]